MKATSLATYQENKQYHPPMKRRILEALSWMGAACMHRLAKEFKKELHCISGRFGELEKEGMIKPKFIDSKHITHWELTEKGSESLINKTETKKRRP